MLPFPNLSTVLSLATFPPPLFLIGTASARISIASLPANSLDLST